MHRRTLRSPVSRLGPRHTYSRICLDVAGLATSDCPVGSPSKLPVLHKRGWSVWPGRERTVRTGPHPAKSAGALPTPDRLRSQHQLGIHPNQTLRCWPVRNSEPTKKPVLRCVEYNWEHRLMTQLEAVICKFGSGPRILLLHPARSGTRQELTEIPLADQPHQ